jgi:hypothetical protein
MNALFKAFQPELVAYTIILERLLVLMESKRRSKFLFYRTMQSQNRWQRLRNMLQSVSCED